MAELPFPSSQESQSECLSTILVDHDILPSSPLKSRSDALASLRSSSLKPRKPPTVTPKRFTKFFTPRSSTLPGQGGRQSKSGRQLRDITQNGNNRRRGTLLSSGLGEDGGDVFSSRPLKRRKQSFDMPSSPPQSSPLRKVEPVNDQIEVAEDDAISVDYDDLPDLIECMEPFPKPIQRLRHMGRNHRLMQRSFGGYESTSRGFRGQEHCVDWRSETANFVTLPSDVYSFKGSALPFCTTSCNTNPIVAFADEEGVVRLMDTSAGANFQEPHLSFKVHKNAIMDLAFSSDDYMLATASGDQTACVMDMQTQKKMYTLTGHNGSLKQVRFHPDDDKMLTTSSRDGSVQIWDLRSSSKTASQILYPAHGSKPHTQTLYSKVSMDIGRAHRVNQGKAFAPGDLAGTSITAFQHLANDRSHLLATASEANSSIKLWDLRNAGRRGLAIPVSSTPVPEHHNRNFAISALALSGDGSRLYSVCRDSVVYAYSSNHLALGCAPEMAPSYPGRRAAKEGRIGVGPLYGFKHPSMRAGSFYVRAAIRKAKDDKSEMLAIGSTDSSPVLIPTDERHLPFRNNRPFPERSDAHGDSDDDDDDELPSFSTQRPQSSRSTSMAPPASGRRGPPIFESFGTALLRGHRKEVTSLSFTSEGNLVTISDDFKGRCWREDRGSAKHLRTVGENGGERWNCGWADVPASWDESDDE
jgi:WD40 repeat protein